MAGQILGGSTPMQAARYQMLILFLISASACIVVIIAVSLAINTLVDEHDCLRRDLLIAKKKEADVIKRGCLWVGGALCEVYEACSTRCCSGDSEDVEFVTVEGEEEGEGAGLEAGKSGKGARV